MTGLVWLRGVYGFNCGDVLIVCKELWKWNRRMRGSSLLQVSYNERSELHRRRE